MTRTAKTTKPISFASLAKEADIQLAIRELLTYMGLPHSVTDASRAWSQNGSVAKPKVAQGWPDISGVIPWESLRGIALFIETKAARTRFQPGQEECHESLRRAGAMVIVPHSVEEFARQMIESGIDHKLLRQINER